jgi:hypothetical protein
MFVPLDMTLMRACSDGLQDSKWLNSLPVALATSLIGFLFLHLPLRFLHFQNSHGFVIVAPPRWFTVCVPDCTKSNWL